MENDNLFDDNASMTGKNLITSGRVPKHTSTSTFFCWSVIFFSPSSFVQIEHYKVVDIDHSHQEVPHEYLFQ